MSIRAGSLPTRRDAAKKRETNTCDYATSTYSAWVRVVCKHATRPDRTGGTGHRSSDPIRLAAWSSNERAEQNEPPTSPSHQLGILFRHVGFVANANEMAMTVTMSFATLALVGERSRITHVTPARRTARPDGPPARPARSGNYICT